MESWTEVLKIVIYPALILIVVLILLSAFRRQLAGATSISVGFAGAKLDVKVLEVEHILQQLLDESLISFRDLDAADKKLFAAIRNAKGTKTLNEIHEEVFKKPFIRTKPATESHTSLRKLRDRRLVSPREGSTWQANKHPEVTRFAQLILKVKSDAI